MNDQLLWQRHGIQPNIGPRRHLHAYVSAAVLEKVDQIIPPRMRSRFVETCLLNAVNNLDNGDTDGEATNLTS